MRAAAGLERDDFAVEHQLARGQRAHQGDDLRRRRGDVVQRTREDRDVIARLVDLHACAVDFVLERRVAELRDCVSDALAGLGKHRPDRPHQLHDERVERGWTGVARGQRGARHRSEIARQHGRPPDAGGIDLCGPRDGVEQHAFERTLAQLAVEQPSKEVLLVAGAPAEQRPENPCALGGRSLSGELDQRPEGVVHFQDLERRLFGWGSVRCRTDRRVPHANPAVPGRAREERDGRLDFPFVEPRQEIGQPANLAETAARLRNLRGREGEH